MAAVALQVGARVQGMMDGKGTWKRESCKTSFKKNKILVFD